LRIRLLEALWEMPRSARELASCLEVPADRLYYHLGQLELAGLVQITEYRPRTRGKVERVYAPAAVEPPGDGASPEETVAFLGSVLDATRADIAAAYRAKQAGRRREVNVYRGAVRLNEEALEELRNHLAELAARFDNQNAEGPWARVLVALVDLQDRPALGGAPTAHNSRKERSS
jgi:predicted ArsR family transcriptional regulator